MRIHFKSGKSIRVKQEVMDHVHGLLEKGVSTNQSITIQDSKNKNVCIFFLSEVEFIK